MPPSHQGQYAEVSLKRELKLRQCKGTTARFFMNKLCLKADLRAIVSEISDFFLVMATLRSKRPLKKRASYENIIIN